MSHIFISYSKKNIAFARHLRGMLENEGFTIWMDEEKLNPSQRWWPEIEKNIISCAAFIVIMSPDAQESDWVEREILVAEDKDHRKEIFPVLLSGKRWSRLGNIQYEDMTAGLNAILSSRFVDELRAVMPFRDNTRPPPQSFRSLMTDETVDTEGSMVSVSGTGFIMPQPFEWIDIPGGDVTLIPDARAKEIGYLKKNTTFPVAPFQIAKYPVTNAQFAKFVEDGGREPRFWDDSEYNQADYPVVGVSWFDAIEFCKWLNDKINADGGGTDTIYGVRTSPGIITLPTEQQWQRAAQGDDGREYPWGDERPKRDLCNYDKNVGVPTAVDRYPDGISPYGVMDMSGNVREWCLTQLKTGGNDLESAGNRILRGGTWTEVRARPDTYLNVKYRFSASSDIRENDLGFRIVCNP
jgi:formylglycine-generating enzyme required for sulfatase activity